MLRVSIRGLRCHQEGKGGGAQLPNIEKIRSHFRNDPRLPLFY
jgi:hypothetical protein